MQDEGSTAAPGWFGKLPGMGDFAQRRMPIVFRDAWDRWLQNGFARLRAWHPDWTERYLKAPLWCFVLGEGVIDASSWLGVLMPSVDGVGRYFPLTLTAELVSSRTALEGEVLARTQRWWTLAAQAALEGLEHDLDALRFDARLEELFAGYGAEVAAGERSPLALPEVGHSLWFTDPGGERGLGMTSQGLPQDEQFAALFGIGGETGVRQEAGS
ncbi:type VI secretion system-associated protein TagF [Variovorax sp. RA8]|uniref:type VI secretion system-associated protein TagF n=1 Tax=Variovorax sp. (strain JCM 16519 / RA8) TaxID=662548 RepID=UPI0013197B79|nr:type VI secretion system-associated protein TagF [Variovorax sp. RA8]VTU36858.1 type VI secretion-associated protein, family [Variovorax sp. RA8]